MQGLVNFRFLLTWYPTRTSSPHVVQEVVVGKASWRECEADMRMSSVDENCHQKRGNSGLHFHVLWRSLDRSAPCKSVWLVCTWILVTLLREFYTMHAAIFSGLTPYVIRLVTRDQSMPFCSRTIRGGAKVRAHACL